MTVYVDPPFGGDELRRSIFAGDLIVLTRLTAVEQLAASMREELQALFAPHDPELIFEHLSPEELAPVLGAWKPKFIHSDRSKALLKQIVQQAGMDPAQTHYDVPKPRTSMPQGHLNTGVAFAFPWHRDAWYSAPAQQINWWMPAYPVRPDNAMSFDLDGFGTRVPNTSGEFDYYAHNSGRGAIAKSVKSETSSRPGAYGHVPASDLVVLPPAGGILLFSGAQLHRSMPNTSGRARYSIDFRTVDKRDLVAGVGAPVVDADCQGTSVRDFVNMVDDSPFDEQLVRSIYGEPPADAVLVYQP